MLKATALVTRRTILTGAAALMATAVMPAPIAAEEYTDSHGVLVGGWWIRPHIQYA
jgi:hypothetical protein